MTQRNAAMPADASSLRQLCELTDSLKRDPLFAVSLGSRGRLRHR
jgi:hypothetical protein